MANPTDSRCYVMANGECISPLDCIHGPGIDLNEFVRRIREADQQPLPASLASGQVKCPSCGGDYYHYTGCAIGEHGELIQRSVPPLASGPAAEDETEKRIKALAYKAMKTPPEYVVEEIAELLESNENDWPDAATFIREVFAALRSARAENERLRNALGEALSAASNGIACIDENDDRVLMEIDWMHNAYALIHHGQSAERATGGGKLNV
jgi:hypothetical protein